MRADWQTNYQHTRSNDDDDEFGGDDTQKKWEWSRYYAWRALPSLKAKLALGEDYLNSDIFDGFNYVGGSVSMTIKCCLPTCAATRQTFPAWHTPQQK
ncbi:export usher protein [Escherichia coli]|uniref:Export usher protein n=1 Tax=Escherichia coli TaxID=562 RepID=A0A376Y590_ECOLX|nr:export usher protein [Escherichia coli]